MADGGRSASARADAADGNVNVACLPCSKQCKNNTAEKYCVQCQEYLCALCVTSHNSFSFMTGHTLQGFSGDATIGRLPLVPTETCKIHTAKLIDFYCINHNMVGCSVCIKIDHSLCQVHYIPDYVKNIPNITSIRGSTLETEQNLKVSLKRLQENRVELEKDKEQIKKSIKNFKEELMQIIDRLDKASLLELDEKFDEIDAKVQEEMQYVEDKLDELKRSKSDIESARRNLSQKFVTVKIYEQNKNETEKRVSEYLKSPKYRLSFTENVELFKYLTKFQGLGTVLKHASHRGFVGTIIGKIKVKL